MNPVESAVAAKRWVDDDITYADLSPITLEPAEDSPASMSLWTSRCRVTEVVCDEDLRWQGLDAFLHFGSGVGITYRTPVQLRRVTKPFDFCNYVADAGEGITTFSPYVWSKNPMSRAFVGSVSKDEQTDDCLRAYLEESLKDASRDCLVEAVKVLLRPGEPAMRFSTSEAAASPLEAVKALRSLLHLTWRQMAAATGIDEGTFYYWQRVNAEPRPSTVRKLMSVYGIVYALVRRRGEADAVAWLTGGSPQRLELLLTGQSERLRPELEELLAGAPPTREPFYHAFRPEEDYDEPVAQSTSRPRLAARRPVRRRQSEDH